MELKEIEKRMHGGGLYFCNDEELQKIQTAAQEKLYEYNHTRPSEGEKRAALLHQMCAEIGTGCWLEPPLHADWGCRFVHMGSGVYANFNLTLVDDTHIYIGDHVLFGPNVTIDTATHPIHPGLRSRQAQYNKPVFIEDNVWLGAGTIVLPGVRIGKNSVIGAGSVVTADIPANVVAVGAPCRVLRQINEDDLRCYDKGKLIDL
ncbi:MAG: sugar O-acetyltransferase [Oscillospiraceae bacterium]|nr:sugar O-acetyltransferase [Oscillospiraceae bacterium]